MNEKQKKFAFYYLSTFNATQSAIKAGYSKNTAHAQGHRLLKVPEIKEYINNELEKQKEFLPNKTELQLFWAKIMRDENEKITSRLAASSYLAKSLFMFNYDVSGWE